MAAPGVSSNSIPPSQTLYCRNLNDKINKDDLRRQLYLLFSSIGPVLDIVALKTTKMRGQAHVVFRDTDTCTLAIRQMQDFAFLGKPMRLSYGKGKSNMIKNLDGSAAPTTSSQQQQQNATGAKSIFAAPPPSLPSTAAPQQQAAAGSNKLKPPNGTAANAPSPQGVKRGRDDEDDDDGDAMEESDGEAMDESDDD